MSRSQTMRWICVAALSLLGVVDPIVPSRAGEPRKAGPPIAYRRILVPADKPDSWPRDGEKFLPVDAREFETRLATANRPPATAQLVDAEYRARLEGTRLVDGRGRWRIELRGEGAAQLPLDEISLVMRRPRWSQRPDEPAQLGWWPTTEGGPLVHALAVGQSGELEFAWHTLPGEINGSAVEIPLQLPPATRSRLILDVPADMQPALDGCVLLHTSPAPSMSEGTDYRRWEFAVGGADALRLRLLPPRPWSDAEMLDVAVSERSTYEITQRGLDLEARLRLTLGDARPRVLHLAIPPELQLLEVRVDNRPFAWQVAEGGNDRPAVVAVDLPLTTPQQPLELTLTAWAPLVTDDQWRLPRFDIQGAFWTSGTITLAIKSSFDIRELVPIGCIQTSVEHHAAPASDKITRTFQAYAPNREIRVQLTPRRAVGRVRLGTSLAIGNPDAEGRTVAKFSVDRGELHSLSAELRPGWWIDAVESIPADVIDQWTVESHGSARRVVLQLRRPVRPEQGVTVVIAGRLRRSAPSEPLSRDSLAMLRWDHVEVARDLLRVQAAEAYELEPIGPLQPLPLNALSDDDRNLIAGSGDAPVFDLQSTAPDAAIRLAPRRGSYRAEIQLDATLVGQRLRAVYRVVCRPQESGIDHVLVHVSEPFPDAVLRWIDADSREPLRAERMPAKDPRLGGLPPGGQLWLVHLPQPYARPVAIVATVDTNWPERRRLPLVSLPDASGQQGRVVVRSADISPPGIVAREMSSAPVPLDDSGRGLHDLTAMPRAAYRYQPLRYYAAATPPELWLGPPAENPTITPLLAVEVRIESYVSPTGNGAHRITYNLENSGAEQVAFVLPPATQLHSATLDDRPAPVAHNDAEPREVVIRLTPSRFRSLLVLDLLSKQLPLANGSQLATPLPVAKDITLLNGEWLIRLPAEFQAFGKAITTTEQYNWRQRLFGPLARRADRRPFHPLRIDDWNQLLPDFLAPTAIAATPSRIASVDGDQQPDGWRAFRATFVALPPEPVTIGHPPTTSAWATAVFLACVTLASLCRMRAAHWILCVAMAAILALLLPPIDAPLASAAFLGLLMAPLFGWAWRATDRPRGTTVVQLLIATMMIVGRSASAEPIRSFADATPSQIHRVLVPVDPERKLVGEKYFVSDTFLAELLQRSDRQATITGPWFLRNLRCEGEPSRRPGDDATNVGTWTLEFDLETLARDTTIELPLVRDEAAWPDEASLDGIPAPIHWAKSGHGCRIHVAEPGRYRLTLRCEPRATEAVARRRVTLTLPQVSGAHVRLASSARLVDPRIGEQQLIASDPSGGRLWEGEFDGAGPLTVSWAAGSLDPGAASAGSVDEFQWLHVYPDRTELDVKCLLPGEATKQWTLTFLADKQWELLSEAEPTGSASAVRIADESATQQTIRIDVQPSSETRREVLLRFHLREAAVPGRLRVPPVALASLPHGRRWLAVSTDATLLSTPVPTAPAAPIADDDFLAAWGGAPNVAPPQLVLDRADAATDVTLAIEPRPTESAVSERTNVVIGRDQDRLEFLADIEPQSADRFGWSLRVPAEFVVQELAAEQSGRAISAEWSRAADDRIHLFFAECVAAPYQIRLVGFVPRTRFGERTVPHVTAGDAPRSAQTVTLFRDDDVLVTLREQAPTPPEGIPPQPPPGIPAARFVGALVVDRSAAADLRIDVQPNEPAVVGQSLAQLEHADGLWFGRLVVAARVERGEAGVLRFRVPRNWAGPFTTTSGAIAERTPADAATALLAIRLSRPLRAGDELRLEVRGPLALDTGDAVEVPPIVPETAGRWERYVAVPSSLEGDSLLWTQTGVTPTMLPEDLAEKVTPGTVLSFRVAGETERVALRPALVDGAAASVRLAETAVYIGPAGGRFTLTRFVIAPQQTGHCTVKLPEGERLVRLSLDGRPALVQPIEGGRWRVQLGPPNFPQRLEIATRGVARVDRHELSVTLCRPTLQFADSPIPVELSLWSLCRPVSYGRPHTSDAAISRPAELAALRLDRLASISEAATRTVVESAVADGYNWFAGWVQVLQDAQRAARAEQQPTDENQTSASIVEPADDPLAVALARSDAWIGQLEEVFSGPDLAWHPLPPPAAEMLDPWHPIPRSAADWDYFVSEGQQDELEVEYTSATATEDQHRTIAVTSIVALSIAATWLARRPAAWERLRQWPQLAGILLGLVVWAWLRPSWLGLAIVIVSLAWWLRSVVGQPDRTPRDLT